MPPRASPPASAIVSTYNAGPFAAGAALAAFDRIGLCHIPFGTGNTERLMTAIRLLNPSAAVMTPSYAAYLIEWAAERRFDLKGSSVRRVLVAGEPGGGEPAFRARLEEGWGAKVTEAMGIGDIGVSLWGECEYQHGMHLGGRGFVHAELIEPDTGKPVEMEDGARGELVLTHLRHRAAPLLRFRTRDHVEVWTAPCQCGRTAPRIRCIGRTDDMLIVRGVNVFPSAIREVVGEFAPAVSGNILVKPASPGVKQEPPLPVVDRAGQVADSPDPALADTIRDRLRATLVFSASIELVPFASCSAANTSRNWSRHWTPAGRRTGRRSHAETSDPGRPSHHPRRRQPPDLDRFLGGRARHAVRLRAAQSRQGTAKAISISIRATAG